MRLPTLTLILLVTHQALAQDAADHRIVISASGGAFIPHHPGKDVVKTFPYTSTPDGATTPTNHQFSGSLSGDFSKLAYVGDIMNFDFANSRYAINAGFGLFFPKASDDGGYLKAGYARVLHFHRNHFRFLPGIDLYAVLGAPLELGRIDNRDQTLQLLGHTAAPQWTETHSSRNGSYTKTYSSDHLSVLYRRNALLIQPKLQLAVTIRRLVLALQAGYMLQLSQGSVLLLQQQDGSNDNQNTIAKIHQPHNGSFNGLYTSLSIGYLSGSRHLFGR